MESQENTKELYYKTLSKFELVNLLKAKGMGKYAFARTKMEIVKMLMDAEPKPQGCNCCCKGVCA